MKANVTGRFSVFTLVVAILYSLLIIRPGLRIVGVSFPRQAWIMENNLLWNAGLWLWLVGMSGWMWVIVSLMWAYLPAHRIASMLQSGLVVIGATLAIAGVVVWMTALPATLRLPSVNELLTLVDGLALGLLSAGTLMAGLETGWVAIDLMRFSPLRRIWVAVAALAGALMIPSPFLLPFPWHLLAAAVCWLV